MQALHPSGSQTCTRAMWLQSGPGPQLQNQASSASPITSNIPRAKINALLVERGVECLDDRFFPMRYPVPRRSSQRCSVSRIVSEHESAENSQQCSISPVVFDP